MNNPYLPEALVFLINTAFSLYLFLLALRFLLQAVQADSYNPISRFLQQATNPPLRPLRRLAPDFAGIDWACVLLMLILQAVDTALGSLVRGAPVMPLFGLFTLSVAEVLKLLIHILIFAILGQVLLSWINPYANSPATVLLRQLCDPLLARARRLLPPVQGVDFSPLLALVFLQLSLILIVRPLTDLGLGLAQQAGI